MNQQNDKAWIDKISNDTLIELFRLLLKIRIVEEKIADTYIHQEMRCPTHLHIGQEAVAAGVCANLKKDDWIFGSHRGHAPYIAKGGSISKLVAELYGKVTGCTKGIGGSQHLSAPEVSLPGCSAIVAGTIPIAVGTALASQMQGLNRVSVTFLGDAATEQGIFHESLNFAALKKLPIIFICENNRLSTHTWQNARQALDNIYERASIYGIPGLRGDGNDVIEVYGCVNEAVKRARKGDGPSLFEFRTNRWLGHVTPYFDYDNEYLNRDTVEKWIESCPVKQHKNLLIELGIFNDKIEQDIRSKIEQEIKDAFEFSKNSVPPEPDLMETLVYRAND